MALPDGGLRVRDVLPIVIDHLERMFPERSFRQGESHEDFIFAGGQRSVVLHLRSILNTEDDPDEQGT